MKTNRKMTISVAPQRPAGLSVVGEAKLRERLRLEAPSEAWVDAQIIEKADVDAHGIQRLYRRHDPNVFPPGGAQTAMVRCPKCQVFTPPVAMEKGECLDHDTSGNWGPSASAHTIQMLQYYHICLMQLELKAEDELSLQEEITDRMRRLEKKKRRGRPKLVQSNEVAELK